MSVPREIQLHLIQLLINPAHPKEAEEWLVN